MATFDPSYNGDEYYYKFFVCNRTKESLLHYDYGSLIQGVFVRWISGEQHGDVASGAEAISIFDIKGALFEKGAVPIVYLDGEAPDIKFWTGRDNMVLKQYINLLDGKTYKVARDTPEITEVIGNGKRITMDGGGATQDTLHIYIQVYDE